jgi:hypothetical protein
MSQPLPRSESDAQSRYASRKFILACAAFVACIVFFALGRMTAAEWIGCVTWLCGLYFAANVGDQAVTRG